MRAGLVTDFYYPWIGGPATLVRNLARGLDERGHSVALLAPSAVGPAVQEMEGPRAVTRVRTVPVPFGYDVRTAGWARREIDRWLDACAPDVIHVHHPFPLSAQAVWRARRRGIGVIATNHTVPECSLWGMRRLRPAYRAASHGFAWWLRWLLAHCDAVATPTETAARRLRDLGFGGHVHVISNGIDTERFRPGPGGPELRQRLGLDGRPVVLYTGRLDAEKEMEVWLRAAAVGKVAAQFVVGGEGTDRPRLERLAAELGLASHVKFVGYLPDELYPLLYRVADVYMITSPVELQSIGTLEAVASGLPVVAVRAGALDELVWDGRSGYLVPPGDWQSAARRLDGLLADRGRRETMGRCSREIARRHTLDTTIAQYESLLGSIATGQGGAFQHERAAAP